jgi:predicted esterase
MPDLTRRSLLTLLLAACAAKPEPVLTADGDTDDYLHARPHTPPPTTIPSQKLERLGLANDRDGYYYVPPSAKTNAPLMLYLHGATGNGQRGISRWLTHADKTGVIVLAPDSREQTWGVVFGDEMDDLAFIDRALNKIFAAYSIDANRIAATGFSDGGTAALSWGLMNGDLFSSIAAFSPGFLRLTGKPIGMPRVFVSHGLNDTILPIDKCGRRIAKTLMNAGYDVKFQVFDGDHEVPEAIRATAIQWVAA